MKSNEKSKTVILVSGKKETGKSTSAEYLSNTYHFKELSFAEDLKRMCCRLVTFVLEGDADIGVFHNQSLKNTPIHIPYTSEEVTPRYLMQKFGTEFIRKFINYDYWVDRVVDKITNFYIEHTFFVISDCRFLNEIERMRLKLKDNYNVITVRLERHTGYEDTHQSEIDLDSYNDWDFVIDNNSSLEDLYKKLDEVYESIK